MKTANVAELKSHLSHYIQCVGMGEEIQICKRNIMIAMLIPAKKTLTNKTILGLGKLSVDVHGSLTEPALQESEWNMLKGAL